MANSRISDLPAGSPSQGSDEFVIARGGFNYKITTTDLATFIGGGGAIATTDLTDVDPVGPTTTGEMLIFNSVSGNYEPSLILDGGLF